MTAIALKLILVHFIADFALQPSHWVAHKFKHKGKSKYLYYHIGVHLVLLLVLLQFNYLWMVGITIVTHYVIDLVKLELTTKKNARWLFVIDQLLHVLVIALLVYFYRPYTINWDGLLSPRMLLLVSLIVFTTYVSAILIKMMLAPYIKELADDEVENGEGGSLKNAGRYIGMLERLFVFGFILLQQWAAIGLLIAAKSVFRFGDLNKGKNRKLTEYVLIGTLLSFGLAILAGMAYNYLITVL